MKKEEFKKTMKDISESALFRKIISIIGILVVAAFIFQAGVFVGFHKVSFGHDWENNYERNFGMMHRGPGIIGGMYDRLPNAHGASGTIIKAELPTIIVLDRDNTEKVVLIKDDTKIRTMAGNATTADLAVDTSVVVIGSPNPLGQIEAKLIRILPSPLPSPETNPAQ